MPLKVEGAVVSKNVRVSAPIERAFNVFTQAMAGWWPEAYRIGQNPFAGIVVEPRRGGRWFERDAEAHETDWGKVLAWEPSGRVVFSWNIGTDWQFNPDSQQASEIEIRFIAVDAQMTLVELDHTKLDNHGDGWEQTRAMLDDANGWQKTLEAFAQAAEAANAAEGKQAR